MGDDISAAAAGRRSFSANKAISADRSRDGETIFALIDLCLDAPEAAHAVLLLYRIVLGRGPDAAGFIEHVSRIKQGAELREIAARFIGAPEATSIWSGPDWLAHARRNAGVMCSVPTDESPLEYCCALATDESVRRRFPLLGQLLPEGLPLAYPPAYALWRAQAVRALPASASGGASLAVFVIVTDVARLEEELGISGANETVALLVPPAQADAFLALRLRSMAVARFAWAVLGSAEQIAMLEGVAQGFATFLLQSDRLDPAVNAEIGAIGNFDVLLFEEDVLRSDEFVARPNFGGGWDRDGLACEPLRHLIVLRGSMLASIAHALPEDPQLVEWSIALQLMARAPERIGRVPAIGRHRIGADRKYGDDAVQLVSRAIASRGGGPFSTTPAETGGLRIRFDDPDPPRVSVIIPTRDKPALLKRCVNGLLERTDYPSLELVIVDNGSVDPEALAILRRLRDDAGVVILDERGPFNWGRFNNRAAKACSGDVLLFLNNDIDVLHSGWLREMIGHASFPDVGAVGAKLLYPNGDIQHAGLALDAHGLPYHSWRHADGESAGYANQLCRVRGVTAVTGACLAVRRDVWREVGGIEEAYSAYFSDVDFCMKIGDTGRSIVWTPHARLLHIEQATFGAPDLEADRRLFQERWPASVAREVFASPHLIESREPRLATSSIADLSPRAAFRPCGGWSVR